MNKIIILTGLVFFFMSCKNNSQNGTFDTAGYTSEKCGSSDVEYLVKSENGKRVEEGPLRNGYKEGTWITYNQVEKIKMTTSYTKGVKNGMEAIYNNRNQIDELMYYQDGMLHGPYSKYRFGKIEERRMYKNNKLNGKYEQFFKNEKLQKSTEFKDDIPHGKLQFYNEEGEVTIEYIYKNGEKVSGGMVEK